MQCNPQAAQCGSSNRIRAETIGEALDRTIARTRTALEDLCILKAKAEAAQMLNTPTSFIHQLAGSAYPL